MATANYARLGQAVQAVMNYWLATGAPAPTNVSGFSITWTAHSGSTPGFFTYTSTTPAVSNQYNVLESLTSSNVPLAYVAQQPELCRIYPTNQADHVSPVSSITNGLNQLSVALKNAVIDMCGTTASSAMAVNFGQTSHSTVNPSMMINGNVHSNTWDMWPILLVIVNAVFNNATYPMSSNNFPTFATQPITINPASAAVNVNVGPPLDVDLTVNQLQGQVSTVSKTTTFP